MRRRRGRRGRKRDNFYDVLFEQTTMSAAASTPAINLIDKLPLLPVPEKQSQTDFDTLNLQRSRFQNQRPK